MNNNSDGEYVDHVLITRHWTLYIFIALFLIAVAVLILTKTGIGYTTYPYSSFARLEVYPDRNDASKFHLSGHVMGSFKCLGPIRESRGADELNLKMVSPILCGDQGGGDFDYVLDVGSPVERITYGRERVILRDGAKLP